MMRFKILKNLGVRKRGLLERAVPWRLVGFCTDLFYQVTYHPYGVAVPETETADERIAPGFTNSRQPPVLSPPPGWTEAPAWTGNGFALGDTVQRVLCYEVGSSGWTTRLTDLHEDVDDEYHYMTIASRNMPSVLWSAGFMFPIP
jgi:hypothetical protein